MGFWGFVPYLGAVVFMDIYFRLWSEYVAMYLVLVFNVSMHFVLTILGRDPKA